MNDINFAASKYLTINFILFLKPTFEIIEISILYYR